MFDGSLKIANQLIVIKKTIQENQIRLEATIDIEYKENFLKLSDREKKIAILTHVVKSLIDQQINGELQCQ